MMHFYPETIELGHVDAADMTYQISTQTHAGDLTASIRQVGLLTPPLLRASGFGRWIIVSGFRRIAALRELGWDCMDARIAEGAVTDLECCRVAIADNANNRILNPIEQSIAVVKLSVFFDDDRALCHEARKSGLHVNPELVRKLKKLNTLYSELTNPVASGALPLTIALEMGGLDRDSALAFLQLFETLKPTLNHQKEILTLAREIALARHSPLFQLIKQVTTDIMDDQALDRPQKIQKIRVQLQRLRNPEIMRFEQTFRERLKRLNLPEAIRLIPPANFEGADFTLSFTFHNINQFQSVNELLARISQHADFKKILDKDGEDNEPIH